MIYFSKECARFLRDLEKNNNREWFQANKERYETHAKQPMERFVADVIAALAKIDKRIAITPSEALFRIYKDVRFSKDKTPYKTNLSAIVSPLGRKGMGGDPGIYIEVRADKLGLAGGVYMPDKEHLTLIRDLIADEPKQFRKLLEAPSFSQRWGTLQGEKNKVLPPEFRELAKEIPWLCHKQFYFWAELPATILTSEELLPTVVEYYKAGRPVADFLSRAYA